MIRFLVFSLICTSCTSQMHMRSATLHQNQLDEVRIVLMDLQSEIQSQGLEMNLLKEQLEKSQNQQHAITHEESDALSNYKERILYLEKQVQNLSARLNEILKLKGALHSISKAIESQTIHKVRSGDTLDKIARKYNTSVNAIKNANNLKNTTIIIGQELKIPCS